MLLDLTIRDLALIEAAELRFGEGLCVITGETGAGKSLLVGALELLLGETPRGGAGAWVRQGAREARVEGRVGVPSGPLRERVRAFLAAEAPELETDWEAEEAELVLGRTLAADGRTRAHVNQRPVTRRTLRGLAPLLFEIHGQNEHQKLLEPVEQLRLLDAFGGLAPRLAAYRAARAAWTALRERLDQLESRRAERRDRLDLLRFQRGELERARVSLGEHARLAGERGLLRNAGELGGDLDRLTDELAEAEGSLLERLRAAERRLARWADEVPAVAGPLEDVRSAAIHAEEAAAAVASLRDAVESDPARLEQTEERLAELERLERKYETDEAGLLAALERCHAQLDELEGEEEGRAALQAEIEAAHAELVQTSADLAGARRALGPKLSGAVAGALGALGLERARFELRFTPHVQGDGPAEDAARFGPTGSEAVAFLLAANPGEAERELRHVASGGEAARIMLALRTVLSTGDSQKGTRKGSQKSRQKGKQTSEGPVSHPGRTLVFDEIDSGVGGRLAPEVGAHLRALAAHHQVLCVTHLPAIAALAHVHLKAAKAVQGGRTRTEVRELSADERVAEVADMIAGGADEQTARAEAQRLLKLGGPA